MTIAACYHSNEGIIFGTDSTATVSPVNPQGNDITVRHFNHAQKIFEVGSKSEIGPICISVFGLGEIGARSHRSLVAEFADELETNTPRSMDDVADRWSEKVWTEFSTAFTIQKRRAQELSANLNRTALEDKELEEIGQIGGGFFLGGRLANSHSTSAYQINYSAVMLNRQLPIPVAVGQMGYAGCVNVMLRLINGYDPKILDSILDSGGWNGDRLSLLAAMKADQLFPGTILNIRDAVDLVYSMIYTTIKGLRFSQGAPLCGGPIEVAAITTDRPFRWVFHKGLDVGVQMALHNET